METNEDRRIRALYQVIGEPSKVQLASIIYLMELLGSDFSVAFYWKRDSIYPVDLYEYLQEKRNYLKTQNTSGYQLSKEDRKNLQKINTIVELCNLSGLELETPEVLIANLAYIWKDDKDVHERLESIVSTYPYLTLEDRERIYNLLLDMGVEF